MKRTISVFIIFIAFQFTTQAQLHDSDLVKKLSVNGFCLCQTTIDSLKKFYSDLKETPVEEMDLAKGCYGQDSRYIAGTGYTSNSQTGLIFQKDPDSNYISKIRLTNTFKGKLPNGYYVDLNNFKLKDLFKLFPQFKDNWQSRDCSDYWKFSNDTLSFYVKIDKSKKPQFPIDEAYYLNKPVEGIDLMISCRFVKDYDVGYQLADANNVPIFFVDSVRTEKSGLNKINADDVAIVSVIKDSVSLKNFGAGGKNGLVYIETKEFASKRYWRYFTSKSQEYARIVPNQGNDSSIQYILNKKVLTKNFEGELALIGDGDFISIKVLNKDALLNNYGIADKNYGVEISSIVHEKPHK